MAGLFITEKLRFGGVRRGPEGGLPVKLEVNGVQLYYECSGSGPPLLLMHGNGEDHTIFDRAVPILSRRFTVYALDTRGHGQSARPKEYHYRDLAEDVFCFITQLRLDRPALYGFSDGGIVGLLLAAEHPALLSRLIVSGANTSPAGIKDGWLRFFRLLNRFVKDEKIAMMLREPALTKALLSQIRIPVLVLAGSRDMVKRSDTDFIAASIPHAGKRILRGEGHGSYIVHKERIAELILQELETGR